MPSETATYTKTDAIQGIDYWDTRKSMAPTNQSKVHAHRMAAFYRAAFNEMTRLGVTSLTLKVPS